MEEMQGTGVREASQMKTSLVHRGRQRSRQRKERNEEGEMNKEKQKHQKKKESARQIKDG
jgi:hypothetical protein